MAQGQEVLIGDGGMQGRPLPTTTRLGTPPSGLRTTLLTLPFFDDFSYDAATPDTNRWAMHPNDLRRPGVSLAKAHNLPSKGVITFDGANVKGTKYSTSFESGLSDTLTSQPIDLSAFTVNDSVWLSFWVERGGSGEAPEIYDSLVVYFDTTGNFDYMQVWALHGNGTSGIAESAFSRYIVRLDTSVFFHDAFRFKFVAFTSLNGELDQFHVDYVSLSANRSAFDPFPTDVSPARFAHSPMYPYTALPRKQVQRGATMAGTRTLVSNAGDAAGAGSLSLSIDDTVGGNIFAGTTIVSANILALSQFGHDTVNGAAFSEQSTTMLEYGSVRLTAVKTAPGDIHPENDTIRTVFRVDSVLAMDDGVSDFGYGLLFSRAFCQEFHIDQPDTMVAVWIHFAPTLHYNQQTNVSTDLLGKGFRLVVWDTLGVDSSLLETSGGMNVDYGTSANQFIRYPLIREVVVPDTFWIGLRQTDGIPIGMGLDRNNFEPKVYFENSNVQFQQAFNRGTLMMRPEFKVPVATVSTRPAVAATNVVVKIYPNPIQSGLIGLRIADAGALRSVSFQLLDLQGRTLQAWQTDRPGSDFQLELGQQPAAGIYWLRVAGIDYQGNARTTTQKIIIQ